MSVLTTPTTATCTPCVLTLTEVIPAPANVHTAVMAKIAPVSLEFGKI